MNAIEIEQAFLGAILINNDALPLAEGIAKPGHFSQQQHKRIFEEILNMQAMGQVASPITIAERLTDIEVQESPLAYCWSLIKTAGLIPIAQVAGLIRANHMRREFQALCMDMANRSATDTSVEAVMSETASLINAMMSDGIAAGMENDYDVGVQILEGLKSNIKPVRTGIHPLDEAMDGGLYPGRSYGFAARKKYGKTTLAATISHNLAENGAKHLFICGEMSPREIGQRILCRVLDLYPSQFRTHGHIPGFQEQIAALVIHSKRNIIYKNAPGLTFEALQQIIPTAIVKHKIGGFILDYWQLVGGKRKGQSTSEHLDEVAQWIADTCRKHGIWSITMAQVNQEGNTRGGEGIRLAFDQVYELGRTDVENSPAAWLSMIETRYTKWLGVGSEACPVLSMNPKGPYFELLPGPSARAYS